MGSFNAWVWLDTGEPVLATNAAGPGPGWQLIGELDTDAAPDLYAAVQRRLGTKGGSTPKTISGYLSGNPRQRAAQEAQRGPTEFHLALGPLGATGGYLQTRRPAQLANPKAPEPPPHPGAVSSPIFIGIKITGDDRGHFDRID